MGIFQFKPEDRENLYTDSHIGKGTEYDLSFNSFDARSKIWELEKKILKHVIKLSQPKQTLDIATGTGRIAGQIKLLLPSAEVHGIDISASMLQVARQKYPTVKFINGDVSSAQSCQPNTKFDLITAFRFFAKADLELKKKSILAIKEQLKYDGYLLVNNHSGFWSIPAIATRLRSKEKQFGVVNSDMLKLFESEGFKVCKSWSVAVTPQDGKRFWLGSKISRIIEDLNFKFFSTLHRLGMTTVFLLKIEKN